MRGEMLDPFAEAIERQGGGRQLREYRGRLRVHAMDMRGVNDADEQLDVDALPDYRARTGVPADWVARENLPAEAMVMPSGGGRRVAPDRDDEDSGSGWGWLADEVLKAKEDREEDDARSDEAEDGEGLVYGEDEEGFGFRGEALPGRDESGFGVQGAALRRHDALFLSPDVGQVDGLGRSGEIGESDPSEGETWDATGDEFAGMEEPAAWVGGREATDFAVQTPFRESRYMEDRLNLPDEDRLAGPDTGGLGSFRRSPGEGSLFEAQALGGAGGSGRFGAGYDAGWSGGAAAIEDRRFSGGGAWSGEGSSIGSGWGGAEWGGGTRNPYEASMTGGGGLFGGQDRGGYSSTLPASEPARSALGGGTAIRGLGDELGPARSSALPW